MPEGRVISHHLPMPALPRKTSNTPSVPRSAASNTVRCAMLQHCNLIRVDVRFLVGLHIVGVDDLG
ncbi:hypothetical protein Bca4012_027389 [Brassica carinata]|uniref:Uncharacterized protein n=1 Tax=Brassica carinata TaxID=52824 RepID=A0A8X7VK67_BRACI|nr:hypothetical protein Bca52824_024383 [Brassica carinata]